MIVDGVTHSPAVGRLLLQLRISACSWCATADREEFDVRSQRKVSVGWGPPVGMGILIMIRLVLLKKKCLGKIYTNKLC